MCEVLHDFLGLMEYILEELPLHVPALEDIFMKLKGGQDRLRAIDARFFWPYHLHNTQWRNS